MACSDLPARACRPGADGFTLVEMITVIVLLGILSAVILPRFADRDAFAARGFRDETVGLLRYAQKTAIAQRRTVCVTVGATGVGLSIAPTFGAACSTPLVPPFTPRNGSGLSGSAFNFLASGATSGSATITLSIAGSNDISIDAETGYVR